MFGTMFLAVSFLFAPDESAFLNRVEALRDPQGLFLDRLSDPTTVSAAATGFGVLALAEGSTRGQREGDEIAKIARVAFDRTLAGNPSKNRGWLSHFTDTAGVPKSYSEVSTIDTAIFYSGMLRAAQILGDEELEKDVRESLARIDTKFLIRDGVFLHGFYWNTAHSSISDSPPMVNESSAESETPVFIPHRWNDSSEGMILYRLFDLPFPMQIRRVDYPLFVYAYPLCFYDDAAYDQLLKEAIEHQIKTYGYWGVTSTDGPRGYVTLDQNVISPILIGAIITKYPQYLDPLQSISIQAAVVSMHLPSGWIGRDDLTIDLASAYILFAKWSAHGPEQPHSHPVALLDAR